MAVVITGAAAVLSKPIDWETQFQVVTTSEIKYADVIGKRGLQYLSPATKMLQSASVFAFQSAGLKEIQSERGGVVIGSNMCNIHHATRYDWQALTEGVKTVSPMEGPNLLLNAPAARLGIFHKLMGFNTTLSGGRCGAIDTIEYGIKAIESGEVDVVIAGTVETLSEEYMAWFKVNGLIQDGQEDVLTEGAAVVILESEEHAKARQARILGVVRGVSSLFDPEMVLKERPLFSRECYLNLWDEMKKTAKVKEEDVNYIHAFNDFLNHPIDKEKEMIQEIFSGKAQILHLPETLGELYTTSGMMQVLRALDCKQSSLHWIPGMDWFGNYRSVLVEVRDH